MGSLSTLDAVDLRVLRGRLEEDEGVERAVLDEETGAVWLILTASAADVLARDRAVSTLSEFGIQPDNVSIETAALGHEGRRRRVRFVDAARQELDSGQVQVTVSLEWRDERFQGVSSGEKGPLIELRTAAQAAVDAIDALTEGAIDVRLIGVKQLRAFDTELIVASLVRSRAELQRYVGSVLATTDPARGASLAVLNALNRALGNILDTD